MQWIKELLYDTEFTVERLKVNGAKLLNEVPSVKREGNNMTRAILKGLKYKKGKLLQIVMKIKIR